MLDVLSNYRQLSTKCTQPVRVRLGAARSVVTYVFRLSDWGAHWWARLKEVSPIFLFHACRKTRLLCLWEDAKRPKWKTHADVQTKPHNRSRLSFLTLPLLFFWSACVFLRREKKITAAWHQVWKPLPANSIWAVLTPALPPSVSGFWGKKQKQIKKPVGLLPLYKSNVTMKYIVRIWQCIPLLFYVEARWVPFIFTMWDILDFFCLCMRELCSLLLDRFEFICALPSGTEEVETPHVVTVILPEHRGYFVQHLGYFLATFLLLAFIAVAVIVLTRRRKKRGICHCLASDNKLVLIIKDSVIQCVWRRVLNLFSRAGVWAA